VRLRPASRPYRTRRENSYRGRGRSGLGVAPIPSSELKGAMERGQPGIGCWGIGFPNCPISVDIRRTGIYRADPSFGDWCELFSDTTGCFFVYLSAGSISLFTVTARRVTERTQAMRDR